jgi:acyl-CoA hydrolase
MNDIAALLDEFRPGRTIVLPGATGELTLLHDALIADADRLRGVHLICPLIPGINRFDYAALHPEVRLTTFMMSPALRPSFDDGRVRVLPLPYTQIARYLAALEADVAILHLTPPKAGRCSFGVSADFGPLAARRAKRRFGVINTAAPRPVESPAIALDSLFATIEIEQAFVNAPAETTRPEIAALARQVADLVPDGAAIQTGIGAAPAAIWAALHDHRELRLRSGMVTDGFLAAHDAGAMIDDDHVAGIAYGSRTLYDRLHGSTLVRFAHAAGTHDSTLAGVERFVAINSALEVDLFGQANLEWQSGRLVSGVGGAPDFNRAARASPGGCSIIALPATARDGTISRIVPRLSAPAPSLARGETDIIVTEHGVARLAGLDIDERAAALIAIASPELRERLAREWHELRRII